MLVSSGVFVLLVESRGGGCSVRVKIIILIDSLGQVFVKIRMD